jgi:hypothetical protein
MLKKSVSLSSKKNRDKQPIPSNLFLPTYSFQPIPCNLFLATYSLQSSGSSLFKLASLGRSL